jgi:hypothetical protein
MKMRWSVWDMKDDPRQKKYEMVESDDEEEKRKKRKSKDDKDPMKMIAGETVQHI